jgi:hypothetical protein
MTDKLYTAVGITTHDNGNGPVTKVRFTNDMYRRVKQCASRNHPKFDFVELPNEMTKVEALNFMLTRPEFASPADQATINDALATRVVETKVKVSKTKTKSKPSLEAIKARKKNTTAEDVLAAVSEPA